MAIIVELSNGQILQFDDDSLTDEQVQAAVNNYLQTGSTEFEIPTDEKGWGESFGESFKQQITEGNVGALQGTIEALGELTGSETLGDFSQYLKAAEEELKAGRITEPEFVDFQNIFSGDRSVNEILDDISKWTSNVGGKVAASFATVAAPAAAGAIGGGLLAGPTGAAIGGITGGVAPSAVLNMGDNYGRFVDEGDSPLVAAQKAAILTPAMTALDVYGVGRLASPIISKMVGTATKQGIGKTALKAAGTEGVTEAAQQGLQEVGVYGTDVFNREAMWNVLEAGTAGALIGAPVGAITGLASKAIPDKGEEVTPKEEISVGKEITVEELDALQKQYLEENPQPASFSLQDIQNVVLDSIEEIDTDNVITTKNKESVDGFVSQISPELKGRYKNVVDKNLKYTNKFTDNDFSIISDITEKLNLKDLETSNQLKDNFIESVFSGRLDPTVTAIAKPLMERNRVFDEINTDVEAEQFISDTEKSIPASITKDMRRLAKERNIELGKKDTPQDFINKLKESLNRRAEYESTVDPEIKAAASKRPLDTPISISGRDFDPIIGKPILAKFLNEKEVDIGKSLENPLDTRTKPLLRNISINPKYTGTFQIPSIENKFNKSLKQFGIKNLDFNTATNSIYEGRGDIPVQDSIKTLNIIATLSQAKTGNYKPVFTQEFYETVRNSFFTPEQRKVLDNNISKVYKYFNKIADIELHDFKKFQGKDGNAYLESEAFYHFTQTRDFSNILGPIKPLFDSLKSTLEKESKTANLPDDLFTPTSGVIETDSSTLYNILADYRTEKVKQIVANSSPYLMLDNMDFNNFYVDKETWGDAQRYSFSRMADFTSKFSSMGISNDIPGYGSIMNYLLSKRGESNSISKSMARAWKDVVNKYEPKVINNAMNTLGWLRESNQELRMTNGVVFYKNANGTPVKLEGELAQAVSDAAKYFKDISNFIKEYYIKLVKTQLGMPLDSDFRMSDIDLEMERLRKEASDKRISDENRNVIKQRLDVLSNAKSTIEGITSITLNKGVYIPFTRFGNFGIKVIDENNKMIGFYQVDGKTSNDSIIDPKSLQETQQRIESEFKGRKIYISPPFKLTYKNISDKFKTDSDLISLELLQSFLGNIDQKEYQKILDNMALKSFDRNVRRNFLPAKKYAGYSREWERVMNHYISSTSLLLAGQKYKNADAQLRANIVQVENDRWRRKLEKYFDYATSSEGDYDLIRFINSGTVMAGNLSTALIQLVNLPTVVSAYLTRFSPSVINNQVYILKGFNKGLKIIGEARKEKTKMEEIGKLDISNPKILRKLVLRNVLTPEEANLIQKLFSFEILQGIPANEFMKEASIAEITNMGKVKQAGKKLMDIAWAPLTYTELISRLSTAMSLNNVLSSPEAITRADKFLSEESLLYKDFKNNKGLTLKENIIMYSILDTHGIYGKVGRADIQKGRTGALFFPFMTYPLQIWSMLLKLSKSGRLEDKLAVFHYLASIAAIGGVMALPAAEFLKRIYELLNFYIKGVGVSPEADLSEVLNSLGLSPAQRDMVIRGFSSGRFFEALLGVASSENPNGISLSNRLSLPVPFQTVVNLVAKTFTNGAVRPQDLAPFIGKTVDIPAKLTKALTSEEELTSKLGEVALAVLPVTALENAYGGLIKYGRDGVTTLKETQLLGSPDNPYISQENKVDWYDRALKTIGFTSVKEEKARLAQYVKTLQQTTPAYRKVYINTAVEIMDQMAKAAQQKDFQKLQYLQEQYQKNIEDMLLYYSRSTGQKQFSKQFFNGFEKSVRDTYLNQKYLMPKGKDSRVNQEMLERIRQ
jgi:hypothetical protein